MPAAGLMSFNVMHSASTGNVKKRASLNMESWQIFHYARTVLPKGILQNLYSREVNKVFSKEEGNKDNQKNQPSKNRSIYYWSANPAISENRRNPIDRLQLLFSELAAAGYGHVVRAALDLLAAPVNYRCVPIETAKSDKGTVDGELTDILQALSNFAEKARALKLDGVNDEDEREQVIEALRIMERQVAEALDAIGLSPASEVGL